MREKGSLQQILNKYEIGTQFCPDESGKPLGFESCFTAFLALIAGMIFFSTFSEINLHDIRVYLTGMGLGLLLFFLENFNKFVYKFTSLNRSMVWSSQKDVNEIE